MDATAQTLRREHLVLPDYHARWNRLNSAPLTVVSRQPGLGWIAFVPTAANAKHSCNHSNRKLNHLSWQHVSMSYRRSYTHSRYFRHPGCKCPNDFVGGNCQFEERNRSGVGTAGIVSMMLVASSLLGTIFLLRIRRRKRMRRYFAHMAAKTGVPPSLDLMARAMEVDDMEYGHSGSTVFSTPPSMERSIVLSRPTPDDVQFMRQSEWPNAQPDSAMPLSIFNDIHLSPMSQESIILAREKEWPNHTLNDASNPIQIFDDISESTPDLSPVQSARKIV